MSAILALCEVRLEVKKFQVILMSPGKPEIHEIQKTKQNKNNWPLWRARAYNPSTWKAEAGGLPGIEIETLSKRNKIKTTKGLSI